VTEPFELLGTERDDFAAANVSPFAVARLSKILSEIWRESEIGLA